MARPTSCCRRLTVAGLLAGLVPASAWALPCAEAVIDAQAQIEVDEGRLVCTIDMQIRADDATGLQCAKAPLALPLLVPSVGQTVLDRGTLPPNSQHVEVSAVEGVQIDKRDGALWLASDVTPSQWAGVRLRYPIAFDDATLQLGVRGAGLRTWYSVVIQAQPPARVQLAVQAPARVSRLEQGSERLVGAALAQPLPRGSVATFVVSDLPAAARQPGRALAYAAGAALLLAGGFALRPRRGEPT